MGRKKSTRSLVSLLLPHLAAHPAALPGGGWDPAWHHRASQCLLLLQAAKKSPLSPSGCTEQMEHFASRWEA